MNNLKDTDQFLQSFSKLSHIEQQSFCKDLGAYGIDCKDLRKSVELTKSVKQAFDLVQDGKLTFNNMPPDHCYVKLLHMMECKKISSAVERINKTLESQIEGLSVEIANNNTKVMDDIIKYNEKHIECATSIDDDDDEPHLHLAVYLDSLVLGFMTITITNCVYIDYQCSVQSVMKGIGTFMGFMAAYFTQLLERQYVFSTGVCDPQYTIPSPWKRFGVTEICLSQYIMVKKLGFIDLLKEPYDQKETMRIYSICSEFPESVLDLNGDIDMYETYKNNFFEGSFSTIKLMMLPTKS